MTGLTCKVQGDRLKALGIRIEPPMPHRPWAGNAQARRFCSSSSSAGKHAFSTPPRSVSPSPCRRTLSGRVVRFQYPSSSVRFDDACSLAGQQTAVQSASSFGSGKGLADPHGMAQVRQKALQRLDLSGFPGPGDDRVVQDPDHVGAVRLLQAGDHAVLAVRREHEFVAGPRGLQLPIGAEASEVNQLAAGQPADARHPFVPRVVVLEIILPQVLSPLSPVMGGGKKDAEVALRTFVDHERAGQRSQGLVDPGRGRGPQGVVQGGVT